MSTLEAAGAALDTDTQRVVYAHFVRGATTCAETLDRCTASDGDGRRRPLKAAGCDARESYLRFFSGAEDLTYKYVLQGHVLWEDFDRRCHGRALLLEAVTLDGNFNHVHWVSPVELTVSLGMLSLSFTWELNRFFLYGFYNIKVNIATGDVQVNTSGWSSVDIDERDDSDSDNANEMEMEPQPPFGFFGTLPLTFQARDAVPRLAPPLVQWVRSNRALVDEGDDLGMGLINQITPFSDLVVKSACAYAVHRTRRTVADVHSTADFIDAFM